MGYRLDLVGSTYERGYAHGYLLGKRSYNLQNLHSISTALMQ